MMGHSNGTGLAMTASGWWSTPALEPGSSEACPSIFAHVCAMGGHACMGHGMAWQGVVVSERWSAHLGSCPVHAIFGVRSRPVAVAPCVLVCMPTTQHSSTRAAACGHVGCSPTNRPSGWWAGAIPALAYGSYRPEEAAMLFVQRQVEEVLHACRTACAASKGTEDRCVCGHAWQAVGLLGWWGPLV